MKELLCYVQVSITGQEWDYNTKKNYGKNTTNYFLPDGTII